MKWHGYDKWYEDNKEHIQKYQRDKRKADPELYKARDRTYYKANRKKLLQRQARRKFETKLRAMDLVGGKCSNCGFDHPAALQFHHRDPTTKKFCLSEKLWRASWEEIKQEVGKCVLLCANCHFILHSKWYITFVDELSRNTI